MRCKITTKTIQNNVREPQNVHKEMKNNYEEKKNDSITCKMIIKDTKRLQSSLNLGGMEELLNIVFRVHCLIICQCRRTMWNYK